MTRKKRRTTPSRVYSSETERNCALLHCSTMCVCGMLIMCRMLAYRAEDISERLEPQELYDRQEFEESIQFDVRPTAV